MPRFDVYSNPATTERKHTRYLLDVQNDCIDQMTTRVVISLRRETPFGPRARILNPLLAVGEAQVALDTAALGAIPPSELRAPVGSLRNEHLVIQDALDTLFGSC